MNKKYIVRSKPISSVETNNEKLTKNIYYGRVVSIDDETDGGRIKVFIPALDDSDLKDSLPYAYPMLPKFFHLYPKENEMVRVFIEDTSAPNRSRFWMGSIISQLPLIRKENYYSALSTTNVLNSQPEFAPSTYPEAKGVYPNIEDIGLIGRDNTDILLKEKEIEIRVGKHEIDEVFKLNKKNPASFRLLYEQTGSTTQTVSSSFLMSDKIALIAHEGNPKFKAVNVDHNERKRIFEQAHPLGRGDRIVKALEDLRKAILGHIHPYAGLPADKSNTVVDLEKIDFNEILQKNIVIN